MLCCPDRRWCWTWRILSASHCRSRNPTGPLVILSCLTCSLYHWSFFTLLCVSFLYRQSNFLYSSSTSNPDPLLRMFRAWCLQDPWCPLHLWEGREKLFSVGMRHFTHWPGHLQLYFSPSQPRWVASLDLILCPIWALYETLVSSFSYH